MVNDKVASPKPVNDKERSDTYVNIEDDDEPEVTFPPQKEQQMKKIQVEEERSVIPAWLKEGLSKKVVVEEQDPFDLGNYLEITNMRRRQPPRCPR